MARRRKLDLPDPAELEDFEERFRRETRPAAPIGVMAADSASAADLRGEDARAEAERHRAAAEAFSAAQGSGLVLLEVPLEQIDDEVLVRDRAVVDETELRELRDSISRNGMRLPIELFELTEGQGERRYGLLSGYRRLLATRQLYEMVQADRFSHIKAVLRDPEQMGGRFAAMVEENEVRSSLSHFERGRIAVIAASQGGYPDADSAVDALFASASKAKRSKVRSFALIFEELGDLLRFPEAMTEKQGLRIATALRAGANGALRDALERVRPADFQDEWAAIEPVVAGAETSGVGSGKPRGGRPKRGATAGDTIKLANGITIAKSSDARGYVLRLEGPGLDEQAMESLLKEVAGFLERA